jgi:hypothetical protein
MKLLFGSFDGVPQAEIARNEIEELTLSMF